MLLLAAIDFGYLSDGAGDAAFATVWAILGAATIALGLAQLKGEYARVTPTSVEMKNELVGTGKSWPIHGLSDLYFDGNTLYRRGDGAKLVTFKPRLTNSDDVTTLKLAIMRAQTSHNVSPQSGPPPSP